MGERGVRDAPVPATDVIGSGGARVHGFQLAIHEGEGAGQVHDSFVDRCTVGSLPANDLVLEDSTVSRFHCEVVAGPGGVRVRDLDSKNGTFLDGVRIHEAVARDGSLLRLGRCVLRVQLGRQSIALAVSDQSSFGSLVGGSVAMRSAFALLERAAASEVTVLLEGETGTGKEGAARALHAAGARRDRPFVVVDCSAIPANLIEGELFGHEKGAFTGAGERRAGAFEAASGGTIFLDEVGELPVDLQPKLLRVLEQREVRRLGSATEIKLDVRIIAATNRDLRAEVNSGAFRTDLYFRLAVLRVMLPPLRERPEDLPLLVDECLRALGATSEQVVAVRTPELLGELAQAAWPGNVRELRNFLERCLVMGAVQAVGTATPSQAGAIPVDVSVPFREARRRILDEFEKRYVEELLRSHGGNVSAAARHAGIGRVSLYALMRRHELK